MRSNPSHSLLSLSAPRNGSNDVAIDDLRRKFGEQQKLGVGPATLKVSVSVEAVGTAL
jgi:hypothetical protein